VRHDAQCWAKLCYESTDIGTTAAVSVVTRGYSDDANGVDLTATHLWLQICRVGDLFGMQYALDGKNFRMVRYFTLPMPAEVKVGLVAQCPAGPGATIEFLSFSVEQRSVKDLRAGL
jgi:regulation of enolase protein 1 (concanavalin A-like superfamily)